MKATFAAAALVAAPAAVSAFSPVALGPFRSVRQPVLNLKKLNLKPALNDGTASAQTIQLPIDHAGSSTKDTFANRFWLNDTFYQPGGPVVLFDVGEANAAQFADFLVEEGYQTAVMQLAAKYKGIGVVWEHRYYGESIPFLSAQSVASGRLSVSNLTADQWQYHTVDQALDDLAYFAANFPTGALTRAKASADDLSPQNTPYVMLGGSYPGMRAAMMRVRHPETVYAAWASSAPVQAQVDMASYWETVQRIMPANCSADYVGVTNYVDAAIQGADSRLSAQVRIQLAAAALGVDAASVREADVDTLLSADIAQFLMYPLLSYQNDGPELVITVCDAIETGLKTRQPTGTGLVKDLGAEAAFQVFVKLVAAVAKSAESTNGAPDRNIGAAVVSSTQPEIVLGAASADKDKILPVFGDDLSWTYQFCSQLGFFQVSDPNNANSIVSRLYSVDQVQAECSGRFPDMIPSSPAVDNVLQYGGWKMNPTRTYFSNGQFDPWRTLSVGSEEDNSPKRSPTESTPDFQGAPSDSQYYGAVYPGQVHAVDLAASTRSEQGTQDAFKKGYALFTAGLDKWLPSFKQARASEPSGTFAAAAPTRTSSGSGSEFTGKGKNGAASVGSSALAVTVAAAAVAFFSL